MQESMTKELEFISCGCYNTTPIILISTGFLVKTHQSQVLFPVYTRGIIAILVKADTACIWMNVLMRNR